MVRSLAICAPAGGIQARHTPASASQSGAMRIFITGLARGLLGLQPFDIEGYG
ncbi:Uncharacterised protein [Acinetobacter baumannii]|nr:Uncharacterised protein [Acinetobacter baumannii]